MESPRKSEARRFPTTESILFFQGPPTKHWGSNLTSQRARKTRSSGIEESGQKTMINFPELFGLPNHLMRTTTPPLQTNIPYKVQHIVLGTAQSILEECCYDFAKQRFPSELETTGWDCAEAAELTKWTQLIVKHSEYLPNCAFSQERALSKGLIVSVHLLRHTAVHRLPTTARGISKLMQYALRFTTALKDSTRTSQLEDLYEQIQAKITDIELDEYALDADVTAMLQNKLDGIVPQGDDDDSLEDEITSLFEMLPPSPELQAERQECDDVI
jgi:hypothetical protein